MTKDQSIYRIILLSVLVTCTGIRDAAAAIPPAYHVTDLGPVIGNGINARGQVTGGSYLWTPTVPNGTSGTIIDLGTLGGTHSEAFGINASGQVTGRSYTTGDALLRAFLYDGTIHDLGTLGGTQGGGHGINDSGQVVGYSTTTEDRDTHAFLYDGTMHDLGTLGGTYSYGWGINDSGQVTGFADTTGNAEQHAFLWTPAVPNGTSGTMIDLGTLGGTSSGGYGINSSGQVTGYANMTGDAESHAFLWTPTVPGGTSGTMHHLGTLGGMAAYGYGINASGQVVGISRTIEDADHAFLYTSDIGMVDLNSLINPQLGWVLRDAFAINDAGQITGQGYFGVEFHGFLLTPVPEPTTFMLVALGLAGLAMVNVRLEKRNGQNTMSLCDTSTPTGSAR